MIQCSNPACQVLNDEIRATCQSCQTPLVHRYLWAVGADLTQLAAGTLLTERYRCVNGNILIDQTPEFLPDQVSPVSEQVMPYLNLAMLAGRIPVPHTCLDATSLQVDVALQGDRLLLLEQAPLAHSRTDIDLLPTLAAIWPSATPLRQLNWLRQIAELWSPLKSAGVAATLWGMNCLRVDESWLRLLELRSTSGAKPLDLADLGKHWQELLPTAQPPIQAYLAALVADLQAANLLTVEELLQRLELGVMSLAATQPVQIALATYTDQGPTRHRNEDACYPPNGTAASGQIAPASSHQEVPIPGWVVVCDGIGGHEGGNVASNLAIATIQARLEPLLQQPGQLSRDIEGHIQQAIWAANDAIYDRNNQEHRQARGRMGTTLVLVVIYPPFLFVAHVGDSRAYRISDKGCSQITLDDDVASREARLGYAFYRDALRQPSAGSLIQALGITESGALYPSIQCSLLDDHSLYLICSDGLSDYDRVEALWWTELRKPVADPMAVGTVGQQLIDWANTYNGHDNVTVGLIALNRLTSGRFPNLPKRLTPETVAPAAGPPQPPIAREHQATTTTAAPKKRQRRPTGRLLLLLTGLGLAIGSGAGWWFWRQRPAVQPLSASGFPSYIWIPDWQVTPIAVSPGTYWQVRSIVVDSSVDTLAGPTAANRLALLASPTTAPEASADPADGSIIPAGSIVQILRRQAGTTGQGWVYLQVCSIPSGPSLAETPAESDGAAAVTDAAPPNLDRLAQPGDQGWLLAARLQTLSSVVTAPTASQRGGCQ